MWNLEEATVRAELVPKQPPFPLGELLVLIIVAPIKGQPRMRTVAISLHVSKSMNFVSRVKC